MENTRNVLICGATGYVGGRLLHRLELDPRLKIRCLARIPENVRLSPNSTAEVIAADLLRAESIASACEGIDTAYFLVHALGSKSDFEAQERAIARNFADAARRAAVRRIIYLGGLGSGGTLSPHLALRHEVGDILRNSGCQVLEFRASIIIGSGSLSFDLVRALTEKLPFMITPRWVYSKAQPISIRDVLSYLIAALDREIAGSHVFEIGGPDQLAYADLIRVYSKLRGLTRVLIRVPFLSPQLSSLWLGLVTPVYARIGRKLIDSLRNDTIVTDRHAAEVFPDITPIGVEEAMRTALEREDQNMAETRWFDAVSASGTMKSYGGVSFGSRLLDTRSCECPLPAEQVFLIVQRIGGRNGWYFADWLWRIRGAIDLVLGGVGMRRGRSHPYNLTVGDVVDFWRVEEFFPNRILRLRAEMRLPGRAWLQFEVRPTEKGCHFTQTAIFDPLGILGRLYWYILYPLHEIIFRGMFRTILKRASKITLNPSHS